MMDLVLTYLQANPPVLWMMGLFVAILLLLRMQRVSYNLGVNDGYGYSCEPWNPGYRAAGNYLRRHCSHRWPELASPIIRNDDGSYESRSANDSLMEVESTAPGTSPHIQY